MFQTATKVKKCVMKQLIITFISTNINEVIRAVFFFFFYEKNLHAPKALITLKAPKAQRHNQAKAQNVTSGQ